MFSQFIKYLRCKATLRKLEESSRWCLCCLKGVLAASSIAILSPRESANGCVSLRNEVTQRSRV